LFLDRPLSADEFREPLGAGQLGGQVGDARHRDARQRFPGQVIGMTFGEEDLLDVRESGSGWGGQHLDGVDLCAAMAAVVGGPLDRDVLPWQSVELVEQAGLVTADGEDVEGVTLDLPTAQFGNVHGLLVPNAGEGCRSRSTG
jgi:hypothetical protein